MAGPDAGGPDDHMTTPLRPRLCFVGPLAGMRPGYVVTQAVRQLAHFEAAGWPVLAVSTYRNRYARLADIAWTLWRRRRDIDVLIVEVYAGFSFVIEDLASHLGSSAGLPIVMVMHGGAFPEFAARFSAWTRRVLGRAAVIVAPSPFLARTVNSLGLPCRIIPNVIDLGQYPYRERGRLQPTLLWMRSFHAVYNPAMAIHVIERLKATHPAAHLVMAGQDKGLQAATKDLALERGVAGAVEFPGFLDMEAKVRAAEASDIFINTSHVDNMPVAVLEACAFGQPVVSTSVGGVPDLIEDGRTGLLCPPDDADAMVACVRRLIAEEPLARRLSVEGRQLATRSAWESVGPQWEELFLTLADRPRPGRNGS